jgi:CheY-like chemotaxis protein
MAIFRRLRRRGHRGSSGGQPAGAPPSPDVLAARLREIAAQGAAEDALEPALKAIVEATRTHAGAVCLFDPRQRMLRLVAESGLSDEGCRRLRSVRRGDPTSWDMPLTGLLNRRAYLIESAARNRYVPRLVEEKGAVRTIACVPLYVGPAPVGTIVLVALAPRSLDERDIRTLERPLVELTSMIEAVRRRGGVVEETSIPDLTRARLFAAGAGVSAELERLREELSKQLVERTALAAELAARTGETDRMRATLEAAADVRAGRERELDRLRQEAERVATLATSLAVAEGERARLAAALEAAAAERAERARAEAALEQARAEAEHAATAALAELEAARRATAADGSEAVARSAELEAEIDRLRVRISESEAAVARERAVVRERERERDRLAHDLKAAALREQRLRDDLQAASGRADSVAEQGIRHAVETAREAEEARAAAVAEAEALREALASGQEIVLALEDEATRANAEIERLLGAGRAAASEHERLEVSLAEARAREASTAARLAELAREADALRRENGRMTAGTRERDAEVAGVTAHLESVTAERDRLREALEAVEAERDRLAAETAKAPAEQSQLRAALERERAERSRLTAALGTVQSALGELEATLSRREAEAAAQAAEIARLVEERGRILAERGAAREPAPVVPVAPAPRESVRVVTVTAPPRERGRVRDIQPERPVVAVLDAEVAWEKVGVDGHQVRVVPPGDDVADRVAAAQPGTIVVNLVAPGALDALATLRAAGSTARFWGCLADPAAGRALALGVVEPATSLDPDTIVELLGRYAGRGTRVVTAGADVDALMSLRQALARGGLSVSMAWDAKQAADLLHVVRPEVVVVDLALPRRDGYGIISRIAGLDAPPSTVIIAAADDASAGFASALADPAHAVRMLSLRQVLAALLARSEAPPTERRHKIRLLGRK